MTIKTTVELRPRFNKSTDLTITTFIALFENAKSNRLNHKVSISDNHVFLRIEKSRQHFWSPQLHLEIRELGDRNQIHGLFGPNPTVWTLFMFLHFVVGTLFIGTSIWGYTLVVTNNDYIIPIFIMVFLVMIWIVFYIAGRLGRKKAHDQMHELHAFYSDVIDSKL